MATQFLLQGTAKWSYDHEMSEISTSQKILAGMVSGATALPQHYGDIALNDKAIIIEGIVDDEDLTIPLSSIKQLYLGFDDLFPVMAVKSMGILWQPLRIEYFISAFETSCIYLVIDFNGVYTHDKEWFNTLTELLQ
ncbi:hypothetical protein SNE25_06650 [Mucilaginibacter sabulilitoris]|uniref:Uncharacterized protein n=1 Tax=Mucilaginibacter sabulilitoris TaxID=1173583 RepID=A0ABZ0TPX5_9SPHI|nr:hypothetical protein [Mucilaginibacter sabulilitoris]WPU95204.1 hypothetical protein SNE25_06650 [Mucilaginibacter sabulilitoris]